MVDVYNVSVRQHQYAAGATLNSKWSDDLVSVVTLSKNNYYGNVLVNSEFTEKNLDGDWNSLPHKLGDRKRSLPDYGKTRKTGVSAIDSQAIETSEQEGRAVDTR